MSDLLPSFVPWLVGLLLGIPLGMAITDDKKRNKK